MSADRSVAFGEYGCSKIRCNGIADGRQCWATVTGEFRRGIRSARAEAVAQGWKVAIRTQCAPNGFDLRDYCPQHVRIPAIRAVRTPSESGEQP